MPDNITFDNTKMPIATAIRNIMTFEHVKMADLAEHLGKSRQNMSMKFTHGDFRESELKEIGDFLGYDCVIQFKKKE